MVIAIDFDATWTSDPKFWRKFVHMALDAGHTVIMVTQRCRCYPEQVEEVEAEIGDLIPVLFAGDPLMAQSKLMAARISGYEVDVWIDDNPHSVFEAMYRLPQERRDDV